jgi:hypothetical protein
VSDIAALALPLGAYGTRAASESLYTVPRGFELSLQRLYQRGRPSSGPTLQAYHMNRKSQAEFRRPLRNTNVPMTVRARWLVPPYR